MSIPVLSIDIPFPLSTLNKIGLHLSKAATIEEVIRRCIIIQDPAHLISPAQYYLAIKGSNSVLVPQLLLSDYLQELFHQKEKVQLEIRPKRTRKIIVRYLTFQAHFECDVYQQVRAVAKQASLVLSGQHESLDPEWSSWGLVFEGEPMHPELQIKSCFHGDNDIPTVTLRREISHQNISTYAPLFKGTIANALARDKFDYKVPFFITTIFDIIEANKTVEGIYRKSGLQTDIDSIALTLDQPYSSMSQEQIKQFLEKQRIHDLAGIVKLYLRKLSTPLIPPYLMNDFRLAIQIVDDIPKFQMLRMLVNSLPTDHYCFLHALSKHTRLISEESATNKMSISNISTCIGPNIIAKGIGDAVSDTIYGQTILRIILDNYSFFFEGDDTILRDTAIVISNKDTIKQGERVVVVREAPDFQFEVDYNGKLILVRADEIEFIDELKVPQFNNYKQVFQDTLGIEPISFLPVKYSKSQASINNLREVLSEIQTMNERIFILTDTSHDFDQSNMDEIKELVAKVRSYT